MTVKITSKITLEGPFFRRDPGVTLRENIHTMLVALAEEGEQDVKAQLSAGQSARALVGGTGGRVSDRVVGRVASLSNRPWRMWAVVSPARTGLSAKQAISLYAAAASIERRSHPFRNTRSALNRSRAVNRAELAKGLN